MVNRLVGSDQVEFYHEGVAQTLTLKLRDPEKLAFSNFLLFFEPKEEAIELDLLLKSLHFYATRSVNLFQLADSEPNRASTRTLGIVGRTFGLLLGT